MKGLAWEPVTVDLHAGDQLKPEFCAINPTGALPVLVDDDGTSLNQSLPITEYLDERYPEAPLLPKSRNPQEIAQGVLDAAQERAEAAIKGKSAGGASSRNRNRNRGQLPAHLPRVERIIEPDSIL